MRRPLWPLGFTLWLAGCAGAAGAPGAPGGEAPPNIVLIVSDDHAWTDYGFMAHPVVRTPNLDALAAQSVVYTRAYTPTALCRPSLASIVTGLYPHEHGITGNDPPGGNATMRDPAARQRMVDVFARARTLPELLGERGYVSFQTGKWWEGSPLDHGFTAGMTHGDPTRGGRHGDEGLKIGREGLKPIRDFIESTGGRPFFLWYAPIMPHDPHTPPARLLAKYEAPGRHPGVARYYAMVEWFDETVGELMRYLDERGLARNTMVIYVADNGWIQPTAPGQTGTDTRAKLSHYDGGTRTPVMIRMPGRVAPARDDATLVSTLDLAPTVLGAAGVRPPAGLSGIDLLRDRAALARREIVFGELFAHTAVDLHRPAANLISRSVRREDGWKLILPYPPNRDVAVTIGGTRPAWAGLEPELYDVRADPSETTDRARERPELVEELRARIDRWWPVTP